MLFPNPDFGFLFIIRTFAFLILKSFIMKKIFTLAFFIFIFIAVRAQTTAMDFTMSDCQGNNMHHLYDELDSGNVVIMEFFMVNCSPCIDAGNALEPMYQRVKTACGNKVRFFQTGFNNTYSCLQVAKWVGDNGFSSVPFDSGAAQVAYYGGFGMPTIAVAAGNTHKLLYLSNQNFTISDTAIIADSILAFCGGGSGIHSYENIFSLSIFPKPARNNFSVSFNAREAGALKIEIENIFGECVQILIEEKINGGSWNKSFSCSGVAKGIYLLKVSLNGRSFAEKIVVE